MIRSSASTPGLNSFGTDSAFVTSALPCAGAMPVNVLRLLARQSCDASEGLPDCRWRACGRLLDVDAPVGVRRLRHVELDASQLEVLVLREAEPEPAPCDEQALLPIDVESLLRVPSG